MTHFDKTVEAAEGDPFNDDGEMWAGGPRHLEEKLTEYYGIQNGQLWLMGDYYDEEEDERVMEALVYFDGEEDHLITDEVPEFGHGPSGAAGVEKQDLPSQEAVDDVIGDLLPEENGGGEGGE